MRWLARHGIASQLEVYLLPTAEAKVQAWRAFAAHADIVIVDDLCHGHEGVDPVPYAAVVEAAESISVLYVGAGTINALGAGNSACTVVRQLLSARTPRAMELQA
jgi:hypothetical protein